MTDDRQTRAQSRAQTRADRMRKYDPTDAATDRQPEEPCMPDYANLSTAEVVHDFAVVRGDLSEQYARDQLTRAIDAKVAEAERRGAIKAWHEGWLAANAHARAIKADPNCPPHDPNPYAVRNGADL